MGLFWDEIVKSNCLTHNQKCEVGNGSPVASENDLCTAMLTRLLHLVMVAREEAGDSLQLVRSASKPRPRLQLKTPSSDSRSRPASEQGNPQKAAAESTGKATNSLTKTLAKRSASARPRTSASKGAPLPDAKARAAAGTPEGNTAQEGFLARSSSSRDGSRIGSERRSSNALTDNSGAVDTAGAGVVGPVRSTGLAKLRNHSLLA
ncbi:unnamed protein product, partial [Amoebophrya sp. A25]|eukprot:GSA25T00012614001.1